MQRVRLSKSFAILTSAVGLLLLAQEQPNTQGRITGIYKFPELSIKEYQNANFRGVANDRKILLGSVGSDLWRTTGDAPGEFWMVTDRGPNGQIRVDGANRRTFWVPEFNPRILRVKFDGTDIKVIVSVPIVGQSGKPVTGLPNFKTIDDTPYDYTAEGVWF